MTKLRIANHMKIIIAILISFSLLAIRPALAGQPTCQQNQGSPYCQYIGAVEQAYINEDGVILLYFDTALDLTSPSSVGITGVTRDAAAAYKFDDDPEYAKLLYASILSAQARGVNVAIQMRRVYSGYLVIDRIWVRND